MYVVMIMLGGERHVDIESVSVICVGTLAQETHHLPLLKMTHTHKHTHTHHYRIIG